MKKSFAVKNVYGIMTYPGFLERERMSFQCQAPRSGPLVTADAGSAEVFAARAACCCYQVAGLLDGFRPVGNIVGATVLLPMDGPIGGTSYLVHYAAGKLTKAALPVNPATITIRSVARIPGTTQQLAGGFTHHSGDRTAIDAVILQYS